MKQASVAIKITVIFEGRGVDRFDLILKATQIHPAIRKAACETTLFT